MMGMTGVCRGSGVDRLEIIGGVPAQGTDEIRRQLRALVYMTADAAAPAADHPLSGRPGRLRFHVVLIVGIGQRRLCAEHLRIVDLGDEQGVAAEILLIDDAAAQNGAGRPAKVGKAALVLRQLDVRELVHIPAGLHTEMPDRLEGAATVEDREREQAALLQQLAGVVRIDAGDGDALRVVGDLHTGVRDAGVGDPARLGRQQKNAVGKAVECFVVHTDLLCFRRLTA